MQTEIVDRIPNDPPRAEALSIPAADGGSIYCVHAGRGPTVLLAHGYLLDLTVFNPLFQRLVDAGFHVVAFDQRGHGRSHEGTAGCSASAAAADYRSVLERFGVEDATLVGHSMGGFLALRYCLDHPQSAARLRRLVLLGANAGTVAVGSLANRLQIPLLELGVMPQLWRRPRVGRALVKQLFGARAELAWLEDTRAMLLRQSVARSLPLLRAMCYDDLYPRLTEIPVPVHVLCGELDRTCPTWHSQRLSQQLSAASYRHLPGLGHMLPYEAPDAVFAAISDK
ncbi:MAG: alpha/beta hydrolase [Polyangiales bacterium]